MAAALPGGYLVPAHGAFLGRAWGNHGADLGRHIDGFAAVSGRMPQIVNIFWNMVGATTFVQGGSFPADDLAEMKSRSIIPMISLGTGVQSGGGTQPDYTNASIISGTHDPYFTAFAQAAATFADPIILRFCWEFQHNNNAPYKLTANGNTGIAQFREMWQRVHGIFQTNGATNVKWLWCPTVGGVNLTNYIGDAWVDYLGWDSYSSITFPWDNWSYVEDPTSEWLRGYQGAVNVHPTKPMIVGEYGVDFSGGDAARWLSRYWRTVLARFPRIVASVYFDAGGPEGAKWNLDLSERKMRAYRQAISLPQLNGTL